ncbi:hypothetical protein [Hoeflea sp. TYP-13]|uniref:hypothetical protein n=1 Tax=Hoeflea sp. TYP-13 TaxID=3230023 RepID=UPI0034C5C862
MNLLWAPGQSGATREILQNLTEREKFRLFLPPLAIVISSLAVQIFLTIALNVAPPPAMVVAALMILTLFAAVRKSQRRMMLRTRHARLCGFTSSDVAPIGTWSREDWITFIKLTAVALALAAAGMFAGAALYIWY